MGGYFCPSSSIIFSGWRPRGIIISHLYVYFNLGPGELSDSRLHFESFPSFTNYMFWFARNLPLGITNWFWKGIIQPYDNQSDHRGQTEKPQIKILKSLFGVLKFLLNIKAAINLKAVDGGISRVKKQNYQMF